MRYALQWVPLLLLLPTISAYAEMGELGSGARILDGGSVLQAGYESAPTVADWNNDGRKDLIVGQESDGMVRLYLNVGTDADPAFSGFSYLQSGGTAIAVTYS